MPLLDDEQEQEAIPDTPWQCRGCNSDNIGRENLGFIGLSGHVCNRCDAVCHSCDNHFNRNSGASHASDYDNNEYCHRCTRDNWLQCNYCRDWEPRNGDGRWNRQGNFACYGCRDEDHTYCDDCDEWVHDNDSGHDCNNPLINDYSYKPVPIFHHTEDEWANASIILKDTALVMRKYRQIAYLGLEIEVECGGSNSDYTNGAKLFDDCDDLIYLKHDGSLNNGFEIVTHPMTLDWAMNNFPYDLMDKLSNKFDSWYSDNAGIHIHVSRDAFVSDSHQARFVNLITRNQDFFQALAGRESRQWARFDMDNLKHINNRIKRTYHTDRYSAVNLQNTPTLEVRIFKSSLNERRLKMSMQLVDACVKYTEKLSTQDMVFGNAFDWKIFADWVSLQARYEILNEYIVEFRTTGQIGE
jgi:hypothetical protein